MHKKLMLLLVTVFCTLFLSSCVVHQNPPSGPRPMPPGHAKPHKPVKHTIYKPVYVPVPANHPAPPPRH